SELLDTALARLVEAGRITAEDSGDGAVYASSQLVIGLDAPAGWEAAVFDHFQALVRTIVAKLRREPSDTDSQALVGGSTYTFVVWPEHPFYDEVSQELARFRARESNLRARVDSYNAEHGIPARHQKIVSYAGQYVVWDDGPDPGTDS